VDGPILEKEFSSFVGMHQFLCFTEWQLANMHKWLMEKWLKNELQCKLTVIPCNYNRKMNYSLPVKPSPNLPNDQAVNLYASLCLWRYQCKCGTWNWKPISNLWLSLFTKSDLVLLLNQIWAQNPVYNGVLCYGEVSNYSSWISLNWNG
jgi:hypothetical protein